MQSHARSLCAPHDPAGALSLVATDRVWEDYPSNFIPATANAGASYRARPTFDAPADFANNTAAAIIAVHKQSLDRHHAFTHAIISTLNTKLLASVGADNKILLKATFAPVPLYALLPQQIVDTMLQEYGTTKATNLQRLRAPLQEPLKTLADLESHMNKFLLASKKLTLTGLGKTDYDYFELFLESVRGFPVVAQTLSTYYARYSTIVEHTIATLFPHLKGQLEFMLSQSTASPFLGAATPPRHKNKSKTKIKRQGQQGRPEAAMGSERRRQHHISPTQLFRGHLSTTCGTSNRGRNPSPLPRRDPAPHRYVGHQCRHSYQHGTCTLRYYWRLW